MDEDVVIDWFDPQDVIDDDDEGDLMDPISRFDYTDDSYDQYKPGY